MSSVAGVQAVFVDFRVPDLQSLIGGARPGEPVFVLDGAGDGLAQIAAILEANGLRGLAAIQIVAHGAAGEILIGAHALNGRDLARHGDALATIAGALAPGGEILLYGCDVASGAAGRRFIADLSRLTGAVVAGASHPVGASDLGGSWTLDAATGPIAAAAPFTQDARAGYRGILNVAPVLGVAGNTISYTEQAAPVALDTGITVADADGGTLVGAKVTLSGMQPGDTLNFTDQNGIIGHFSGGILFLIGTASVTDYQAALRSITFSNASNSDPTAGGTTPTRTVTWQVDDGNASNNLSASVITTININAVDSPAVAKADAVSVSENATLGGNLFSNNGSGADTDPDGGSFSITQINGAAFTDGQVITLASGAHLIITNSATGTFSYDPNHAFDYLPAAGAGASDLTATDTFTYTITGGSTATVTLTVSGVDSDDTLIGTGGNDVLSGGAGNDVYYVQNAGDVVTEAGNGGTDTVVSSVSFTLPANVEALYLTGSGQTATGSSGSDILLSAISATGANTLVGGDGGDLYYVNHAGDVVTENGTGGIDTEFATVSYTISANVELMYMVGTGLTGTGSSGNDRLASIGGPNTLKGLAGDDVYYVHNSADVVTESANAGTDTVVSTVSYTIADNVEVMYLVGTGLTGTGSAGADTLVSSGGPNTLTGLGGNDLYVVNNVGDVVNESASGGFDSVIATVNYTMPGNVEVLYMLGSGLTGTGSSRGDTLVTLGANTLTGAGGDDLFVFVSGKANGATVTDFGASGDHDTLAFSGFGTAAQGATFTQVGSSDQWVIHSGIDSHNETITFSNHAHPADFVFV